ncbi:hypothetical protein LuPra_04265 [Luteitalea pratensis]|uniref:Uncharacterized protein n=1 Tax=Luteitalea pratensis TaxID=1855912 RepID=A0A143PRI1_LUTPR|nr:hypothetical protein [Luteitalea pratensis]AMY11021.1 hypothetical protein LuPra_04265 [Luteitalea pratensis]
MLTRPTRWFGSWGRPHLSDESLLELHALLVAGEHSVAGRYLRHVKQCEVCAQRLDGVREDAAALRQDVTASIDARITPTRLERQFDVIMRRLEGHSGKVLPFPTTIHRPAEAPTLRRWVAMAAASGLLIGIGAGRLMGPMSSAPAPPWQKVSASPATGTPAGVQESDEQMLVEIDAALARSRTKEFRALDELTPRVADARARSPR